MVFSGKCFANPRKWAGLGFGNGRRWEVGRSSGSLLALLRVCCLVVCLRVGVPFVLLDYEVGRITVLFVALSPESLVDR